MKVTATAQTVDLAMRSTLESLINELFSYLIHVVYQTQCFLRHAVYMREDEVSEQ